MRWVTAGSCCVLLAACSTMPLSAPEPSPSDSQAATEEANPTPDPSPAVTPREYRRDGAEHIYRQNPDLIFHGRMPPLLASVSTTRIFINEAGMVTKFEWLRPPRNQPGVAQTIKRLIYEAQPFPAPQSMGAVAYTDTWLWHSNGLFQLDTLTEGQLDKKPIED